MMRKLVPLNNGIVTNRIDEMADDVENKLINSLRENKFTLQIDESIIVDNKDILLASVRFINESKEIVEKFLFATYYLITDTKRTVGFSNGGRICYRKIYSLNKIIACATDNGYSITGRHIGFIAHLKNAIPGVIAVHCVIHHQHLAAQNPSIRLIDIKSLQIKTRSFNDRLFRELFHGKYEEFERLLFRTVVKWLSKVKYLWRFVASFDTIIVFLDKIDLLLKDNF